MSNLCPLLSEGIQEEIMWEEKNNKLCTKYHLHSHIFRMPPTGEIVDHLAQGKKQDMKYVKHWAVHHLDYVKVLFVCMMV